MENFLPFQVENSISKSNFKILDFENGVNFCVDLLYYKVNI